MHSKHLDSPHTGIGTLVREFIRFGIRQASASAFAGALLALIVTSHFYYPLQSLARYDFLFLAAIAIQIVLIATRLEQPREVWVIVIFHIVATVMELFKTHPAIASWHYPGDAVFRIAAVPLFTGFMYSAVGSYIARAWRLFEFRFNRFPPPSQTLPFAAAVYVNFFSHHFFIPLHWPLVVWSAWLFGRTTLSFRPANVWRRMPLPLGLLLVALFIYIAENIGTLAGAWAYPNQSAQWSLVSPGKVLSWYLLMQISFVLVAVINRAHKTSAARYNHK